MVPPQVRDGVETVFGIQDKGRHLTPPVLDANGDTIFEITATTSDAGLTGPFVHGKPGERFLYLGWRPANGPPDAWIRRWKISLKSLPAEAETAEIAINEAETKNVWIGSDWKRTSNL
jgi:hypothetical protein